MKKHITLLSGLLLVSGAFAQVQNNIPAMSAKKQLNKSEISASAKPSNDVEKVEGATLWSNNFSSSANWTASAVSGTNAANFGWQLGTAPNQITTWSFATNTGTFAGGGGYAGCENGDPTAGTEDTDAEWILTYDSIFDFSAVNNLIFQFQEYGALFTDLQAVEVSTNGGTTWTSIGNNNDLGMVTAVGGTSFANPTTRNYSVSMAVGALTNNMKFRFRVSWPNQDNGPGVMYGWFVDNVKFIEGYMNDLAAKEVYALTGDGGVQYTKFPTGQVAAAATTEFSGIVSNWGTASQNAILGVTGPNAYSQSGTMLAIAGFDEDSLSVTTPYTIPATTGTGTFTYTVTSNDGPLSNTTDDTKSFAFEVSPNVMATDKYTGANSITGGFTGWSDPTGDPAIGTAMEIFVADQVGAIQVGICDIDASGQSDYVGNPFHGVIYKLNTGTQEFEWYGDTDDHELATADFGNLVVLSFDEPLDMDPGLYLVMASMYTGGEVPIAMAGYTVDGNTLGLNGDGNVIGLIGNDAYKHQVEAPVVRLDFNDYTGINEFTMASEVNVYPNPFGGSTAIDFNLKSDAEVSVVVTDLAGRTVYTVPATHMNAGKQTVAIDGTSFQAGIYNYTLTVGNETITKRIVKK